MEIIKKVAHKYKENIADFLQDLITCPSYSGQEESAVKRMIKEMQACGFDEAYADKLGNAVGRIGHGKIVILFDGHIDVVGIGDPDAWDYPPFEKRKIDGKIYGRGSVDEKPALACMVYAGKIIKDLGLEADYTLYVVGSVMEEDCDGYPLIHLIENENIRPHYVVLGEPTDLHVYRGHRGRMEIIIRTKGVAAHGAHCDLGDNAIYKMAPIIAGIEALHPNLKKDDFLGKGSITISGINSKSPSQCSVADECEIYIDRRMTAGETKESVIAELKAICGDTAEIEIPFYNELSWKGTLASQEKVFPTWVLPATHVLVQAAKECADVYVQPAREVSCWHFSTNGVATMGRYNIPTIGFAPGLEELSHSTGEWICVDELVTATMFYVNFPQVLLKKLDK